MRSRFEHSPDYRLSVEVPINWYLEYIIRYQIVLMKDVNSNIISLHGVSI